MNPYNLKFRAWCETDQALYSWDDLCGRTDVFPEAHPITALHSDSGWVVEQCVGLLDRNRKEAYINDIVKHIPSHILGKVLWDEKKLRVIIEWSDGDTTYPNPCADYNDFDIVGNTHQNPELCWKESGR